LDIQTKVVDTLKQTKSPLTLTELADKSGNSDKIEIIYKIVRHLNANDRGVVIEGIGQPTEIKVSWQG
jgi:glucose-6-phosphate isomerase